MGFWFRNATALSLPDASRSATNASRSATNASRSATNASGAAPNVNDDDATVCWLSLPSPTDDAPNVADGPAWNVTAPSYVLSAAISASTSLLDTKLQRSRSNGKRGRARA